MIALKLPGQITFTLTYLNPIRPKHIGQLRTNMPWSGLHVGNKHFRNLDAKAQDRKKLRRLLVQFFVFNIGRLCCRPLDRYLCSFYALSFVTPNFFL